jgi:imidazole glycerol-phosphate synthase subunit HisH
MYIALINYGMGNIKSVENSFINAGAEVRVTSDPAVIDRSAAIVLPGVGGFIDAYINLEKKGLIEPIYKNISEKPFLGICLGMQLLFEYSLEVRKQKGLGIFKGSVQKITGSVKIPHMGWNQINIIKKDSKILKGIKNGENFYFVHSYHAFLPDHDNVSSTTDYGTDIVASIEKDNIYGFQFHPEKSSVMGQRLIKNFLDLAGGM